MDSFKTSRAIRYVYINIGLVLSIKQIGIYSESNSLLRINKQSKITTKKILFSFYEIDFNLVEYGLGCNEPQFLYNMKNPFINWQFFMPICHLEYILGGTNNNNFLYFQVKMGTEDKSK